MSLEETFIAFMQNYQSISVSNRGLENQNEHLWRQIEEALKQTKKDLKSPSGSTVKMMANQVATFQVHHVRRSLTKDQ